MMRLQGNERKANSEKHDGHLQDVSRSPDYTGRNGFAYNITNL